MTSYLLPLVETAPTALPLYLVTRATLTARLEQFGELQRNWVGVSGFTADSQAICALPGDDGTLAAYLIGMAEDDSPDTELWALAGLSETLPPGDYRLAEPPANPAQATRFALGWALGAYSFQRYKARKRTSARLVWPSGADRSLAEAQASAIWLGRDLINTPAGDMLPSHLAATATALAAEFGADCSVTVGDDLLAANYPAIHAVGRASANAPRLIDIVWGDPDHPKITLVGKGVCFDSGGLDIKPSAGMKLMKKDMGGAAAMLAVARMVMATGLPVRLRVLVPAVENAISGNAYRPLDVLKTRKGLSVEVGNTDAEGRLILCDALAEADREAPALLIDCATLTGAARVALGTELPAMFCRQDDLAADFGQASVDAQDPMWRLPLWGAYRKLLDSKIADISSTGDSPFAGAITAALFLSEFVASTTPWLHIDMMGWNNRSRPGRPEGGEVQLVRAIYELIRRRAG